ncbi:MAG: alpha-E domain-containing protein, partial [Comamonadaceae bacterium]|nr:alpha-E domain-containing protein [Comamonadaceae bacterium]
SRTADHLFWMSRYTERAENTARMLSVSYETSMLPMRPGGAVGAWQGVLSISELIPAYQARYRDITRENVLFFMVADESNPASIISCLRAARENARAVRGVLTTEVWETQNQTWLGLRNHLQEGALGKDPGQLFEWVKYRSHLSRGVALGTMLQDEAFNFLRLGTFLERADNTARLLDVRFHAIQRDYHGVDAQRKGVQPFDFYHWSALLRSVSAFEVYRKVYRDVITPERVAELLVLRADMPRSLHASMREVVFNLKAVAHEGAEESLRKAGRLLTDVQYSRIDEILDTGLHAYLTHFLDRVNQLGEVITKDYLVPEQ